MVGSFCYKLLLSFACVSRFGSLDVCLDSGDKLQVKAEAISTFSIILLLVSIYGMDCWFDQLRKRDIVVFI